MKYHNRKITTPEGEFDSRLELGRWEFLRQMEKAGKIRNLRRQVEYEVLPRQARIEYRQLKTKVKEVEVFKEHAVHYIADFAYEKRSEVYGWRDAERKDFGVVARGWLPVVEDTKGECRGRFSTQTPDFRIKKKLMLYFHNIEVKIITKTNQEI